MNHQIKYSIDIDSVTWSMNVSDLASVDGECSVKLYGLPHFKHSTKKGFDSRSKFVLRRHGCRPTPLNQNGLDSVRIGSIYSSLGVKLKLFIVAFGSSRRITSARHAQFEILKSLCPIEDIRRPSSFPRNPGSFKKASRITTYQMQMEFLRLGLLQIEDRLDSEYLVIAQAYDLKYKYPLRTENLQQFERMMGRLNYVFPTFLQCQIDVGSEFWLSGSPKVALIFTPAFKEWLKGLFKVVEDYPLLLNSQISGFSGHDGKAKDLVHVRAYYPLLEGIATNPLGLVLSQANFEQVTNDDFAPNLEDFLRRFVMTQPEDKREELWNSFFRGSTTRSKDQVLQSLIAELEQQGGLPMPVRVEFGYSSISPAAAIQMHEQIGSLVCAASTIVSIQSEEIADMAIAHLQTFAMLAGSRLTEDAPQHPGPWSRAKQLFRTTMDEVLSTMVLSHHVHLQRMSAVSRDVMKLPQAIAELSIPSMIYAEPGAIDLRTREAFLKGKAKNHLNINDVYHFSKRFGPAMHEVAALALGNWQLDLMQPIQDRRTGGLIAARAVLVAEGGAIVYRLSNLSVPNFKLDYASLGLDVRIQQGPQANQADSDRLWLERGKRKALGMTITEINNLVGPSGIAKSMSVKDYVEGRYDLKWLDEGDGRIPASIFVLDRIVHALPDSLRMPLAEVQHWIIEHLRGSEGWEVGLTFMPGNSLLPRLRANVRPFVLLEKDYKPVPALLEKWAQLMFPVDEKLAHLFSRPIPANLSTKSVGKHAGSKLSQNERKIIADGKSLLTWEEWLSCPFNGFWRPDSEGKMLELHRNPRTLKSAWDKVEELKESMDQWERESLLEEKGKLVFKNQNHQEQVNLNLTEISCRVLMLQMGSRRNRRQPSGNQFSRM